MKKYEGKSIRKGKTHANALPKNVGFPGNMRGNTRTLDALELAEQVALGVFVALDGKPFYGL